MGIMDVTRKDRTSCTPRLFRFLFMEYATLLLFLQDKKPPPVPHYAILPSSILPQRVESVNSYCARQAHLAEMTLFYHSHYT